MRPTTAPEMSAAVMIANVPWNAMKSMSGMVPLGPIPTPFRKSIERSPTKAPPSPKAREYPATAHSTPEKPNAMKLIIIVFKTFLDGTSPP